MSSLFFHQTKYFVFGGTFVNGHKKSLTDLQSCLMTVGVSPEAVEPLHSHQRAPCAISWHLLDVAASTMYMQQSDDNITQLIIT